MMQFVTLPPWALTLSDLISKAGLDLDSHWMENLQGKPSIVQAVLLI